MARQLSAKYKSTLAEVSAPEAPLVLLVIEHPDLAVPVRLVNDTQDLTSHGKLYIAVPFRVVLPDDFEGQLPKASLAVDNVGGELMYWIEQSGGGKGSTVTLSNVLRSQPDIIEWSVTLGLNSVNCTMKEITGQLGYENIFAKPAISVHYRPFNTPGLF